MSDTAVLRIRVESSGISSANNQLSSLSSIGKSTESSIGGLVTKIGALISVTEGLGKLVETQRQFDVLNAGLITATGSTDKAAQAFGILQQFAAKTPYTLDQSIEGFTKLVNLGLTPSERAMKSYGDTSAAMGKDLMQMIEAVSDASTGEFERLKEFGIKASSQGDKVAFTFRGTTTTVKNSASEIESYLIGLGENNFAGAMETRMATLDGAISNLEDSWSALFLAVSQQGSGEVIREAVTAASDAMSELTTMINSGELQGYISAWTGQWTDVVNTILDGFESAGNGVGEVDKVIFEILNSWGVKAKTTTQLMSNAFWEFPANIKALIQIATVHLAGFVDKAVVYGKAAAEAMNPFSDGNINIDEALINIDKNVQSTIDGFLSERDAAINKLHEQFEKSKQDAKNFVEEHKNVNIVLGDFKPNADKAGLSASQLAAEQKKADQAAKQHAESVKRTTEDIADMTIELQANKLEIQGNARAGALLTAEHEAQKQGVGELTDKYVAAKMALYDYQKEQEALANRKSATDWLGTALAGNSQEAQEKNNYDQQLQELRDFAKKKALTKQEITNAETALEKTHQENLAKIKEQYAQAGINVVQSSFSVMTEATKTFAGEESAIYKGMFLAQQAFQVVSIMANAETAAAAMLAHDAGFLGLGAVASSNIVRGMGYASAGVVAGMALGDFAGAFDNGGYIPTGKVGIAAEIDSEFVNGTLIHGPANVTSRKDTAKMLNNESSGGNVVQMTVHQTIQVTGNGDANLVAAMQQAANQGAQMAYQAVANDFKEGRGIRKLAGI